MLALFFLDWDTRARSAYGVRRRMLRILNVFTNTIFSVGAACAICNIHPRNVQTLEFEDCSTVPKSSMTPITTARSTL